MLLMTGLLMVGARESFCMPSKEEFEKLDQGIKSGSPVKPHDPNQKFTFEFLCEYIGDQFFYEMNQDQQAILDNAHIKDDGDQHAAIMKLIEGLRSKISEEPPKNRLSIFLQTVHHPVPFGIDLDEFCNTLGLEALLDNHSTILCCNKDYEYFSQKRRDKYLQERKELRNKSRRRYHVTKKTNLDSIKKNGLTRNFSGTGATKEEKIDEKTAKGKIYYFLKKPDDDTIKTLRGSCIVEFDLPDGVRDFDDPDWPGNEYFATYVLSDIPAASVVKVDCVSRSRFAL